MTSIKKVAIVGVSGLLASGNFGTTITKALANAGFDVTIITRPQSATIHPTDLHIIRTEYAVPELTKAFTGQDAVVCVVGPGGIKHQVDFIDAAEAAGVYRFIIDDFGWGPNTRGFPEFDAIHAHRRLGWDLAKARADVNPRFTWTGLSTGNPVDWAMKKFPLMGFDIANHSATIYDSGTEIFTGTTLEGIGQAVVGVMQHPDETANRFLKVASIHTCQNDLLDAFQNVTGQRWGVRRSTTKELIASGKIDHQAGAGLWRLKLVVAQLYDVGEARGAVAPSREQSDSELLGVKEESSREVVAKSLG